ncbi:WG repeat-containing protein [Hoylesella timonensis]|nr:WG repeat-containing protein [Hoylesella timonensis]
MYLVLKVDTTARYEQYAYVNQDGQTVVPYNRYLQCYTDTIRTIGFVFKPNVGCVAINNKGKELFNVFMANNGNDYPKDGLFRILDKSGTKMGVANMNGQVIVKPKYDAIFPYYEGLAAVAVGCKTVRPQDDPEHEYVVGGKWGFIDKQGKEVIPLEYDSIANYRRFKNGKALVLKGEKFFQIDSKGRTLK